MERNEIEEKYKWNLKDLFESDEAWEAEFASLDKALGKEYDFARYKGTLNTKENILAYFKLEEECSARIMRLYSYASLRKDEDLRIAKYAGYVGKVMALYTKLGTNTAFETPELCSLDDSVLEVLISDPDMAAYDYAFKRIRAQKKYVLSEGEERLLALSQDPLQVSYDAFQILDNVELPLPEIEYEGKTQPLTHGLYQAIQFNAPREKREEAFKKYYAAYAKILTTLAVTYYGNVKQDIFYRTARGYESCLKMALFQEDVSEGVYRNLIDCVDGHVSSLHRYIALRKKAMGGELHPYDLAVPLVKDKGLELEYDEAYELVIKALAPLGKEYQALLKKAHDERWIDVYETTGKRNGAYSAFVFGTHPYVLLNYGKTAHDVFTIAHEMGHTIHSYFSFRDQPQSKSEYKIFVAEVASTVNEVLLWKYLIKNSEEKNLKLYLVNYFVDMIRTTLFRQTQFAEFEERAHAMAEEGEPLNKENLTELYYGLNQKYYGSALTHDSEIGFEWARIPHFYSSFYVYKYATGITAAIAIASRILEKGESAVKEYFSFLSGGCSTDPVSLLKLAGCDLTKKEPFEAAMHEFEAALDEFEALL